MYYTKSSGTLSTSGYNGIKLWVYGAGSSKTWKFRILPTSGGSWGPYKTFTTSNGAWTEITATWAELGNPASIYQIIFQENTGTASHTAYFDDIRMY